MRCGPKKKSGLGKFWQVFPFVVCLILISGCNQRGNQVSEETTANLTAEVTGEKVFLEDKSSEDNEPPVDLSVDSATPRRTEELPGDEGETVTEPPPTAVEPVPGLEAQLNPQTLENTLNSAQTIRQFGNQGLTLNLPSETALEGPVQYLPYQGDSRGVSFSETCPPGKVITELSLRRIMSRDNSTPLVAGIQFACKSFADLPDPNIYGDRSPVLGHDGSEWSHYTIFPNSAFYGWLGRPCTVDGNTYICDLQPMARTIKDWGVNNSYSFPPIRQINTRYKNQSAAWEKSFCPDDFLLVGLYGSYEGVINQLGGICQKVRGKAPPPRPVEISLAENPRNVSISFQNMPNLGDSAVLDLKCPEPNQVGSGFNLQWGEVMKGIQMECRTLTGTGVNPEAYSATEQFFAFPVHHDDGTLTNWPNRTLLPDKFLNGYAAIGFSGKRGDKIDCLDFIFAPVDPYAEGSTTDPYVKKNLWVSESCIGGSGGSRFEEIYCPAGYVMTGLKVNMQPSHYDMLHVSKMECREVRVSASQE